jgi:hypothetical protein
VEEVMRLAAAVAAVESAAIAAAEAARQGHSDWLKDKHGLVDDFPCTSALLRAWAAAVEPIPTRAESSLCGRSNGPSLPCGAEDSGATLPPLSLQCLAASTLMASLDTLPQALEHIVQLELRLSEAEVLRCINALVAAATAAWRGEREAERERTRERLRKAIRKREEERELARRTRRRLAESTGGTWCGCGRTFEPSSRDGLLRHLRDSNKCTVAASIRRDGIRLTSVEEALRVRDRLCT